MSALLIATPTEFLSVPVEGSEPGVCQCCGRPVWLTRTSQALIGGAPDVITVMCTPCAWHALREQGRL